MAQPRRDVCEPWATEADLCSPCDDYSTPVGLLDDMLLAASNILFKLSGRQYPGECSMTVRPCSQYTSLDTFPNRAVDAIAYSWPGACGCARPRSCGCRRLPELLLGRTPVVEVTEVKVDGVVLPPSSYRIDDYRYLVRIDGEGWPCCQDLSLPDTAEDTFSVTFTYGLSPPPEGVHAAAVLACELALACQPESADRCRLPQRVQSVTRQGVSILMTDPTIFLQEGRTGLFEVDLFLFSENPRRLARRSTVMSPDIGPRVRRVDT